MNQTEAAVKVALVLTEDRMAETLKAHRVATARTHAELEAQMQQDAEVGLGV